MLCTCFSGKQYADCCKKYHDHAADPDPLALMRSRYSAYAMGLTDYIIDTTHPDHPSKQIPLKLWKEQIASFCSSTQFLGLEILKCEDAPPYVYVTFYARLAQENQDVSFKEKSQFAQVSGKWLYRSGEIK